jgi:hypothetical protein
MAGQPPVLDVFVVPEAALGRDRLDGDAPTLSPFPHRCPSRAARKPYRRVEPDLMGRRPALLIEIIKIG